MNVSNSEPKCEKCNIIKSEYDFILNNVSDERALKTACYTMFR